MGVVVAIAAALYVWRTRDTPSSKTGSLLLLAAACWVAGYALELARVDLPGKVFFEKVQFVSACIIPTAWLVFTLQYTTHGGWLTRWRLVLLSGIPLAALLLALTNEAHNLIWYNVHLDSGGALIVKNSDNGIVLWLYMAYAYALLFGSTFLIVQALVRSRRLFRWQAAAVLLAVVGLWLINALSEIFMWQPLPNLEMMPVALGITVPVIAWGFLRLRIVDIVPVAREAVIESMEDGVIVLDVAGRVVDMNAAAESIIDIKAPSVIGQPLEKAWPELSDLVEQIAPDTPAEMTVRRGEMRYTYDVRVSPLSDWRGQLFSRAIVLRDISERKRAEDDLHESETRTRRRLEEQTALLQATQALSSTLDLRDLLDLVAEQMAQSIDVTSAYIVSHDQEAKTSTVIAEYYSPDACAAERVSDLGVPYPEDDEWWLEQLEAGNHDVSHIDDDDLSDSDRAHMELHGVQTVLYIPLRSRGQFIGHAEMWESRYRREFSPEEIALCQAIAQSAAVALDNAQLYDKLREELLGRETLLEITSAVSSSLDLGRILLILSDRLLHISGFQSCTVSAWEKPENRVRALAEHTRAIFSPETKDTYALQTHPTTAEVLRTGQPKVIRLGGDDPEVVWMDQSGLHIVLFLPLLAGKETIGLVEVGSIDPGFTFEVSAVQRCQRVLQEAALSLEPTMRANPDETLLDLTRELAVASGGTWSTISEYIHADMEVRTAYEYADLTWEPGEGPTYSLPDWPIGWKVLREGAPAVVRIDDPDLDSDARVELEEWGALTLAVIPLSVRGERLGIIELYHFSEMRDVSAEELRLWRGMADQAALAIENARLFRKAQQDLEDLSRTEKQLRESVQEKEVLLREIHHRVKNNLQIISSLLNLQSRRIDDDQVRKSFQASQDRIRSMALVHERLYQSNDLAKVDFLDYINVLIPHLLRSQAVDPDRIDLAIDADQVFLDIESAIPCGLIIGELLSNSLKHAFPDGRRGRIDVSLKPKEDGRLLLCVSDDGMGMDPETDPENAETLGLQLVSALAEQMGAEIDLDRSEGTSFHIEFGVD
jgi:PAS domain S-box-containing protein